MEKCALLERDIRSVKKHGTVNVTGMELLKSLLDSCSNLFFKECEISEITCCFASETVSSKKNFMGLLFLHGFANIAVNLPFFAADRTFREALSLYPQTAMRLKLLKCAADSGHGYAALMYGSHISRSAPDTALEYFLIACGLRAKENASNGRPIKYETESSALWEIGYMFENHYLEENKIAYVDSIIAIDNRIEEVLNTRLKLDDDEIIEQRFDENNNLHLRDYILGFYINENEIRQITQYTKDKCKIYALKLYLYIAKRDLSFPKAFNSLGKLILGEYISLQQNIPQNDIDKIRFGIAKNYLDIAIHFGNTNAMVNLAVFYHNRLIIGKKLKESEKNDMIYYFKTAAALEESVAQQRLGDILLGEQKYEEAKKYLQYAADKNDARACHSLGKIHTFNLDDKDAVNCFEKALKLGYHDAAYDLAELYLLRFSAKAGEPLATTYRLYAVHLLEERMSSMTEEYREKAARLLEMFS